ncbi:MAG: hypothetical protein JRI23_28345 [Deltaproteobacteria bacterium]|nr:hypothetical protein [Deltaproteobacteria bacterium]MBW2536007.1 hypothetical protein [Deltaproteobacteria bacterium]
MAWLQRDPDRFGLATLGLGASGCNSRSDYWEGDDPDPYCREHPAECDGDIGGRCVVTDDCSEGVCCRDADNCGGGMCLYLCGSTADCPPLQACEHGYCFFTCSSDADCGPGQSCEHHNTVCEYDGAERSEIRHPASPRAASGIMRTVPGACASQGERVALRSRRCRRRAP